MVFFAAGLVKGAMVLKHEAKKNRIRNAIISAPDTQHTPSFTDAEQTVTIERDWWGGDGGSYSHEVASISEDNSHPSRVPLANTSHDQNSSLMLVEVAEEVNETASGIRAEPSSNVTDDNASAKPQPSETRRNEAPAGSFAAELRRTRSKAAERSCLNGHADKRASDRHYIEGSYSADLLRRPRSLPLSAHSRNTFETDLSTKSDDIGIEPSAEANLDHMQTRTSIAPSEVVSASSISHVVPGSYSAKISRTHRGRLPPKQDISTVVGPEGASSLASPTVGSFAAVTVTSRSSSTLFKTSRTRLQSQRNSDEKPTSSHTALRPRKPKPGSFLEATGATGQFSGRPQIPKDAIPHEEAPN